MSHLQQLSDSQHLHIDRYELLAELASGGMATVFLARLGGAGGFQRLYAIKRLHPHLAREPEFVQMFLDEARLAARIHHPHVVPILEVGESEAGHYLVMEYIEGETLARLLGRAASQGKRVPVRLACKILLDTLAGLQAAHELRDEFEQPLHIVHRDVSPQNVLVGVDGAARITDFGVARASSRLTTTRAGQLKGKLGYMAPEQAHGEEVDQRADLFAVGVMFWEALVGRRLFKPQGEASDAEILKRLLFEPIALPSQLQPEVPAVFDAVCMRALERDPKKRFTSCAEFSDALEQAAQSSAGIATVRELVAYVDTVAGPELAAQREAVRNWAVRSQVSRLEASEPSSPTSRSSSRPKLQLATENSVITSAEGFGTSLKRGRGYALVWGGLAAVVIGGTGIVWAGRHLVQTGTEPSAAMSSALAEPVPSAPVQAPATASAAVPTDSGLAAESARALGSSAPAVGSAPGRKGSRGTSSGSRTPSSGSTGGASPPVDDLINPYR